MALDYISMAREQRGAGDMIARCRPSLRSGRDGVLPWRWSPRCGSRLAIASGLLLLVPDLHTWRCGGVRLVARGHRGGVLDSSVVQGVLSPVVGMLVDRFGPTPVMLGGACLLGGACVLSGQIGSLWPL